MNDEPSIYPEFKRLSHARFIKNAVHPVNDNFRVSISYNCEDGLWHVGSEGNYQMEIQVGKPYDKYWSLVEFEGLSTINIFSDCKAGFIERLAERAKGLVYDCEILIKDEDGIWKHRFHCATGFDKEQKVKYCHNIFGKDKTQIVPKHE